MSKKKLDPLLQLDLIEDLLPKIGKNPWETLYRSSSQDSGPDRFGMNCALLDEDAVAKAMTTDSWDIHTDEGKPCFSQYCSNSETVTTYLPYGTNNGVRPLVHWRSFAGAYPRYLELDQEFRLYHNLAEDKQNSRLLAFDSSGREIEVVRVRPHQVEVRLKYLKQFLAGTGYHLGIYVDSVRFSRDSSIDVGLKDRGQSQWMRWAWGTEACDALNRFRVYSWLLAKVILRPSSQDNAGVWPFVPGDTREVKFIICVDEDGNDIEATSGSDEAGSTTEYLTPVYFRRDVLTRYYSEPERYSVTDGLLSCLDIWCCAIDNNHESYVVVFLGDLGRDMPYEERHYWRQYNVAPEGGVSRVNFLRSFMGHFAAPEATDLVFRSEYRRLVRTWERTHGWPLYLPLASGDEHNLEAIRIPVTNSQVEFDSQVGNLTKLLIDSLNEKQITKLAGDIEDGAKSITKLAGFLSESGFSDATTTIQFLRDLQTLRSKGTAHRKGSSYKKILKKMNLDLDDRVQAFRSLLEQANTILKQLRLHYCPDQSTSSTSS